MLLASIITLVLVGASAALFSNWMNKKRTDELTSAREAIRSTFVRAAHGHSTEQVLRSIDVPDDQADRARRLLKLIPQTLGVSDGVLPGGVALADIFRTSSNSHKPLVSPSDQVKTGHAIEPFAYDLVANLLNLADQKAWKERAKDDASFPQTEDELLNRLMSMSVAEFVRSFAPVVRSHD